MNYTIGQSVYVTLWDGYRYQSPAVVVGFGEPGPEGAPTYHLVVDGQELISNIPESDLSTTIKTQ